MDERQALEDAFRVVFPAPPSGHQDKKWSLIYVRFTAMLDAGAYLDAAMMLVPEGYRPMIVQNLKNDCWGVNLWLVDGDGECCDDIGYKYAPTPSAALLSAILAARNTKP